jgi:hypothetical protein
MLEVLVKRVQIAKIQNLGGQTSRMEEVSYQKNNTPSQALRGREQGSPRIPQYQVYQGKSRT